MIEIRPQPRQWEFLASRADIAIYGGAAGGGKTWALLLEPLRHVITVPGFAAVIFRRNLVQVKQPGGLWDQSVRLYGQVRGRPRFGTLEWSWDGGGTIKFAHLENDATVLDWQGAEVPLLCFDELTHFSRQQFFYMLSRNRSTLGVRPYVRATTNPDADSWVAEFIAWWIDPDTGFAIPERAGKLRWFSRVGDALVWADSAEELQQRHPEIPPKSVAFIPGSLADNAILMRADPGYRANLLAMPAVERARLLDGNWRIRPAAGLYFQRGWCKVVDAVPAGLKVVRGWDLAATPKTELNDPDGTAGVKIGRGQDGRYYVLDAKTLHGSPADVERLLVNTASADGRAVEVGVPQDPGQAGKSQVAHLTRLLDGYTVRSSPERGDKLLRFGPFSAQAEAGNVMVLRGAWNEAWFAALEAFPEGGHDDAVDATSRAYGLFHDVGAQGFIDYYGTLLREQQEEQARAKEMAVG